MSKIVKVSLILVLLGVFMWVVVSGNTKDRELQDQMKKNKEEYSLANKDALFQDQNQSLVKKLKEKQNIRALVIGDGVAESSGVSDQNEKWHHKFFDAFDKKYGIKTDVKMLTSHSTNTFGAWVDFCSDIEKSKENYDLVILCLGQNEENYGVEGFSSIYENIISKIKRINTQIEIIVVLESSIRDQAYYQELKKISGYYELTTVDMQEVFHKSGKSDKELIRRGSLPNEDGCKLYAKSILDTITEKIDKEKISKYELKNYLYEGADNFQNYNRISTFSAVYGFDKQIENYGRKYINSNRPGDFVEAKIKTSIVGVYAMGNSSGGIVKVYIDDVLTKEIDLFASGDEKKQILISNELEYKTHKVRIEIADHANKKSSGSNARIFGIIANTKKSDQN